MPPSETRFALLGAFGIGLPRSSTPKSLRRRAKSKTQSAEKPVGKIPRALRMRYSGVARRGPGRYPFPGMGSGWSRPGMGG